VQEHLRFGGVQTLVNQSLPLDSEAPKLMSQINANGNDVRATLAVSDRQHPSLQVDVSQAQADSVTESKSSAVQNQ
jgi:hypothetical protein